MLFRGPCPKGRAGLANSTEDKVASNNNDSPSFMAPPSRVPRQYRRKSLL
jgi:hypothetical protein